MSTDIHIGCGYMYVSMYTGSMYVYDIYPTLAFQLPAGLLGENHF